MNTNQRWAILFYIIALLFTNPFIPLMLYGLNSASDFWLLTEDFLPLLVALSLILGLAYWQLGRKER
jgi:hypothetical protein